VDSAELHTEQPMPTPTDGPSVQGMVRYDLKVRERIGRARYGTALQPHNGRDALRDLYEELLDAACYIRQAIAERPREDVDAAVAAVRGELEPEIRRRDDLIAELRRQLDAAIRMRDQHFAAARRVPGLRAALDLAWEALEGAPQSCRFHGTDFGALQLGLPRCESCRLPYLVAVALQQVRAALGDKATGGA
jgi:hypothetical protein